MDMANWYRTLPNCLTFLRLVLIPVFVFFLVNPSQDSLNTAAAIFVCAAVTDYADGLLARRYSAITDFGKLFDPLADKILVMAALVMLVSVTDGRCQPMVPGWMVVAILAREFWVTGLRAFAAAAGTVVAAKSGGKVKSFLQMVSILAILLNDMAVNIMGYSVSMRVIGLNLLLLSLLFSYLSAFDYSIAVLSPEGGKWSSNLSKLFGCVGGEIPGNSDADARDNEREQ